MGFSFAIPNFESSGDIMRNPNGYGTVANFPVVADQPGATFGKPPFNQWPDLWMDGNNAVLTGFRFGAALHRAFLQVYIFRFQVQKFRDTPPGI